MMIDFSFCLCLVICLFTVALNIFILFIFFYRFALFFFYFETELFFMNCSGIFFMDYNIIFQLTRQCEFCQCYYYFSLYYMVIIFLFLNSSYKIYNFILKLPNNFSDASIVSESFSFGGSNTFTFGKKITLSWLRKSLKVFIFKMKFKVFAACKTNGFYPLTIVTKSLHH